MTSAATAVTAAAAVTAVTIDHPEAEQVQPYRHLTQARTPDAPIVIEGHTALERLIAGGHAPHSILTTPANLSRIEALVPRHVPRLVAPATLLREIVGYAFHRGVLALAPRPKPDLPAHPSLIIAAERITDPSNVGALIRNARALGADAVIFDPQSGDPFSRRAIRTSMGSCFHIPVLTGPLLPALYRLRDKDVDMQTVAAACDSDASPLHHFRWPARCVLLVGNEGYGLSTAITTIANARVRIPMVDGADSLNVAAATAVLLYDRLFADRSGAA